MRLPLSKVYRAFPELDRFDDAACRAFVSDVSRQHWWSALRTAIFSTVIAVLLALGGLTLIGTEMARRDSALTQWAELAGLVAVFVGPIVFGMAMRDWWLRRRLQERIDASRCFACNYSLIGMPAGDAGVCCPECGAVTPVDG